MADNIKFTPEDLNNAKEFNSAFRDINEEVNELFSGLNSITGEINNQTQGYKLASSAVRKLTGIIGKVKDIQDGITAANSKDLLILKSKAEAERKNLEESQRLLKEKLKLEGLSEKEVASLANINGLLEKNNGTYQKINDTLEQVIDNEKVIEEKTGLLGTLAESFSSGLKAAGLGALDAKLGIGEALEATKSMVRESGGNVSKMQAGADLAKRLGSNLKTALGPAAAIGFLVSKFVEAFSFIDSSSGEVAKNLGISAKEGRALVAASNQAAISSGDLLVSTKDVLAAQTALNAQFGTSVKFAGEFAAEFASVQERTGLSSEAMGRFAEQSMIVGGSIKDQLAGVQEVTMAMNAQEGVSLNQKDIQEGIANISNRALLTAGRNTKELANQVFQSKLLGVSQSQLETIGSSLLDFSSSIESEMQAELLLGRQINLERARAAALAGDNATLAAEIRKEVGTAADFQKLNVIQQNALAKAMGMTTDELSASLIQQEKLNAIRDSGLGSLSDAQEKYNKALEEGNLSEELKNDLQKAGLLNQFESATQQEKMNGLMDKFADLFIRLAEPLMPLLDGLVSAIVFLEPILGTLAGAIAGFMIGGPVGAAIGAVAGAGLDVSAAISRNSSSESSSSLPGLATGGIVTRPTTALIGEGGEPEAIVPLSRAQSMGFGGSDEIKQTNALLKELISAVKQGGDVYIDGAKAGKSLALATSRMG
tara:strand:- start:12973 stop:15108 length:2136 start_codon:yes stop_codon:yes gene_type:complete